VTGPARTVRCAIYTRKSTEQGLEQEFNSLDAQRESGEAYVRSRAMEGWVAIPDRYDDGGYSGGNTDRPAFRRLMEDVRAGKVDMVVCYKLDRLSRRLFDFADIFKTLEANRVGFSCVTQELNSSTSTGRMMINILMSFAQYEREVTCERVKDKMRATRMRGLWPGGTVPYGYRRENKRLVPDPETAPNVQRIFEMFDRVGKPKRIVRMLNEQGILRDAAKGRRWHTPSLANFLRNVVYIGRVKLREESFPGVHEPLVTREVWDRVQAKLDEISVQPPEVRRRDSPALLAGIVRCGTCGSSMGYLWTRRPKTGVRYGYYTDIADNKRGASTCPVRRVSANVLDPVVEAEVMKVLRTHCFVRLVADALGSTCFEAERLLADDAAFWRAVPPDDRRKLVRLLVETVYVFANSVEIRFRTCGCGQLIKEIKDAHGVC